MNESESGPRLNIDPRVALFAGIAAGVIVLLLLIGNIVGNLNREATLRNQQAGQQQVVSTYADKMWKTVSQDAQVPAQYKKDFLAVYDKLVSDRYPVNGSGQDPLLKFVMESNPQYDGTLYTKLMTAIEAQRADLTDQEKLLVGISVEHNNMFDQVWSGFVLRTFGRSKTTVSLVTSDKTKDMFQNGENDVNVFSN